MKRLHFTLRSGISQEPDTAGYKTLTAEGHGLHSQCMGGGYDMLSTCLADILQQAFPEYFDGTREYEDRAKMMDRYYGFTIRGDGSAYLDGGVGVPSIEKFASLVMGVDIAWHRTVNAATQEQTVTGFTLSQREVV